MAIREMAQKVKSKVKKAAASLTYPSYDMSTKESRERQAECDYENAKTQKEPYRSKLVELDNYYNLKPYTHDQAIEIQQKLGLNFTPPVLPDARVQVESQIDDVVPAFQFSGRDDDLDNKKAKIRENVVDFICYNNGINELNLDNERNLNTFGTSFWKVAFDESITGPGYVGDIVIGNPDPANIFPDPNAYDVDDCEFIIYSYRIHRRKARRIYGEIVDEIANDGNWTDTEIYEAAERIPIDDETMQIIEYFYRDDDGDIACSILINFVEVKWIEKYWALTRHSGNKMFPIIKYGKTPLRKSFWDQGEIEPNIPLFDAANREFITAILNDAFMANDILIVEEGALADGQEDVPNVPGARVTTKQNRSGSIKRLGGVSENSGLLNMIQFIGDKIQENNSNYESAQGKEPVRVTTSSGIAQLNERSQARKDTKNAGRAQGFVRLAKLIDWTALEFYNTRRTIMIQGDKPDDPRQVASFVNTDVGVPVTIGGQKVMYFPTVDVEINVGEGIKKSKAFTLAATQELSKITVTPENVGIVMAIVDLLDLPNSDEIKAGMQQAVDMQMQAKMAQQMPQATPVAAGGGPGAGGMDIEQILAQLPPEMRDEFMAVTPEQQAEILDEFMALAGGSG